SLSLEYCSSQTSCRSGFAKQSPQVPDYGAFLSVGLELAPDLREPAACPRTDVLQGFRAGLQRDAPTLQRCEHVDLQSRSSSYGSRTPIAVMQRQEKRGQYPLVTGRRKGGDNRMPLDAFAPPMHQRRGFQAMAQSDPAKRMAEVPDLAVPDEVDDLMLDSRDAHGAAFEADGTRPIEDVDRLHETDLPCYVEQLAVQVDLANAPAPPDLVARATRCIAGALQCFDRLRQGGLGHQEVEIAQHAPAIVRIESVRQTNRPLEQHRLDAGGIQDAYDRSELLAKLGVAFRVGRMNRLEERAEFLIDEIEQLQIAQGRGQGRQHELRAGKADDPLPIGAG